MNGFDIGLILIFLFAGLFGFLKGALRQVFSLLGLILGFFLAGRYAVEVGNYINSNILHLHTSSSAVVLIGFVTVFFGVWISFVFIGLLVSIMKGGSPLKALDSVMGAFLGMVKMFVLISIVLTLAVQIKFFQKHLKEFSKDSLFFPIMVKFGKTILGEFSKID